MEEAVTEIYRALRDTREGGRSYVSVGTTAKNWSELGIDADGTFEERPVHIMDS